LDRAQRVSSLACEILKTAAYEDASSHEEGEGYARVSVLSSVTSPVRDITLGQSGKLPTLHTQCVSSRFHVMGFGSGRSRDSNC
jgi:hypothetical protein